MHHVLSRFLMIPHMIGQKGAETAPNSIRRPTHMDEALQTLPNGALHRCYGDGGHSRFRYALELEKSALLIFGRLDTIGRRVYGIRLPVGPENGRIPLHGACIPIDPAAGRVLLRGSGRKVVRTSLGQPTHLIRCDPNCICCDRSFLLNVARINVEDRAPLENTSRLTFACSWTI